MTSLVNRNFFANFAGKMWSAILALAVVPLHIHFLGIEAYGLIGVFLSLVAILSLLDFGLGNALNRELAQYSILPDKKQEMHDLLRTLEIIYWLVGILAGLTLATLAPLISQHWIQSKQLPEDSVTKSITMMGLVIACQWPRALYYAGLMGIQKQVTLNILSTVMATVLNVGGILILWRVSPTITALMSWYIVAGLVETLLAGALLKRSLPTISAAAKFRTQLLAKVWRFAAGMTGISVMSVILTQIDKVILSKVLTLEAFGYYTLAWRLAAGLYYLIGPVTTAYFPRFSQLAVADNQKELAHFYHKGCQLMSVLVLPATAVLAVFPKEILLLWTHNPVLAENSGSILGVLAAGTALNGVMGLPAALQFAHGWTRMVFVFNTLAVILLAPLTYIMALRYGGLGAAYVWLVLNCAYVVIMLRLMHKRLLPGHLKKWFLIDFGAPCAAVLCVTGLWKLVAPPANSYIEMLLGIGGVSVLCILAAALSAPQIRPLISRRVFPCSSP